MDRRRQPAARAVWFDYPRGQMWVRRNVHFGEPIDATRALVLESPDDTYRRAVIKNAR